MFRDTITRTVGNRELILGLDDFYRDAMKAHEVERLLPLAREVAGALGADPLDVPIEGYYTESPELELYFRIMRGLQGKPASSRSRVDALPAFAELLRVVQSPVFGVAPSNESLLPSRSDALYFALRKVPMDHWDVLRLTEVARDEAIARDDISLVGLACRACDPVCIAALRESTVLYAGVLLGAARLQPRIVYAWKVDPQLEAAANRFVDAFAEIVPDRIPPAHSENVELYYHAAMRNDIAGRCVRIGLNDAVTPVQHYHWAVKPAGAAYEVEAFWDDSLWTTARYRRGMYAR